MDLVSLRIVGPLSLTTTDPVFACVLLVSIPPLTSLLLQLTSSLPLHRYIVSYNLGFGLA